MTTSRRIAPLPLAVTALLALLALALVLGGVLLWSTPADARAPERVLVSNAAQLGDDSASTGTNDHAQLFTTGANTGTKTGGWVLTSVIVDAEDVVVAEFDVDICEAHATTELPTSTCTALMEPAAFVTGNLEFTHAGLVLSASTKYLVVVKPRTGVNVDITLDSTTNTGQDAAGLTSWSIKDKFDWNRQRHLARRRAAATRLSRSPSMAMNGPRTRTPPAGRSSSLPRTAPASCSPTFRALATRTGPPLLTIVATTMAKVSAGSTSPTSGSGSTARPRPRPIPASTHPDTSLSTPISAI